MPFGEWAVTHQNLAHQWPVGVSVQLIDYYQTVSELQFLGYPK